MAQSWLLVLLKGQRFGLPATEVRELVPMPELTEVPETPEHLRGVSNRRGKVAPVIDLRNRLGMDSVPKETEQFCELMERRRQDHENWLAELEAAVRENRQFGLATDPHKCAFGRWYDSYKPENPWVGGVLRRFAEPHANIHALASEVLSLRGRDDRDAALHLIARSRDGVLQEMIKLFRVLQQTLCERVRETMVMLERGGRAMGVSVDSAVAVETFMPGDIEPLPLSTHEGLISRCVRPSGSDRLVLLIETGCLFGMAE